MAFFFAYFLLSTSAQARWVRPDEASYSIESYQVTLHIKKTGHYESTTQTHIKILNERGRSAIGTMRFNYSPQNEALKLYDAKVKNDGDVRLVPADKIVDQPVRVSQVGFDDSRQIMVAFPQIKVGSEILYKLDEKSVHLAIDNHYSRKFYFGKGGMVKNYHFKIESERPLYFSLNDPYGAIELKTLKIEKDQFLYEVYLKKNVVLGIMDEPRALVSDKKWPWFVVSTARNFGELFTDIASEYEKVLSEPLPPAFMAIKEKSNKQPTAIQKINQVLALQAESVRYMGDWRTVRGGMIPHSLKEISNSFSGDCKDLAVLVTKILRELGIKAWVALVNRGAEPPFLPAVPYHGFNHAIVFVNLDGRARWLDPTNFQAFAEGVFEDIADRQALVLNPKEMALQRIEFSSSQDNKEDESLETWLKTNDVALTKSNLLHTGLFALPDTGAFLKGSKTGFEELLIEKLTNRSELLNYKIESPNLTSRTVQPLQFEIEYSRPFRPAQTSMGPALDYPPPELIMDLQKVDAASREADFKLRPPSITNSVSTFHNAKIRGNRIKNCQVNSSWVDYTFRVQEKPIRVTRRLEIKKYLISAEDLHSKEFTDFQNKLRSCGRVKYLVYDTPKK